MYLSALLHHADFSNIIAELSTVMKTVTDCLCTIFLCTLKCFISYCLIYCTFINKALYGSVSVSEFCNTPRCTHTGICLTGFYCTTMLILIYLSTAVGLTPDGSTHLHINNTWNITFNNKTTQMTNLEECWPCPVFANYTLAFALQLREKHGKTSVSATNEYISNHRTVPYRNNICY
jgi:hypothetical protein